MSVRLLRHTRTNARTNAHRVSPLPPSPSSNHFLFPSLSPPFCHSPRPPPPPPGLCLSACVCVFVRARALLPSLSPPLTPSHSLSVRLCLSVCLSVYLCICLSVYLSVSLSSPPSLPPSLPVSVSAPSPPSGCPPSYLSRLVATYAAFFFFFHGLSCYHPGALWKESRGVNLKRYPPFGKSMCVCANCRLHWDESEGTRRGVWVVGYGG